MNAKIDNRQRLKELGDMISQLENELEDLQKSLVSGVSGTLKDSLTDSTREYISKARKSLLDASMYSKQAWIYFPKTQITED